MAAGNQERDRKSLTFSQAERLESIPEPLKLGELSQEARSLIWREFLESILGIADGNSFRSKTLELRVGTTWLYLRPSWCPSGPRMLSGTNCRAGLPQLHVRGARTYDGARPRVNTRGFFVSGRGV